LNTDLEGLVDEWGRRFVEELDYGREAANGERFRVAMESRPDLAGVVTAAPCDQGRVHSTRVDHRVDRRTTLGHVRGRGRPATVRGGARGVLSDAPGHRAFTRGSAPGELVPHRGRQTVHLRLGSRDARFPGAVHRYFELHRAPRVEGLRESARGSGRHGLHPEWKARGDGGRGRGERDRFALLGARQGRRRRGLPRGAGFAGRGEDQGDPQGAQGREGHEIKAREVPGGVRRRGEQGGPAHARPGGHPGAVREHLPDPVVFRVHPAKLLRPGGHRARVGQELLHRQRVLPVRRTKVVDR
jgi:hypothetical protein